jgi:hypothetical protein
MVKNGYKIKPQIFADERGCDPRSSAKICGLILCLLDFLRLFLCGGLDQ